LLALGRASVLLALVPLSFPYYGRFIDEFYYVACVQHLDFGYVDHPPLAGVAVVGHAQCPRTPAVGDARAEPLSWLALP
jgi:hypothetical protein